VTPLKIELMFIPIHNPKHGDGMEMVVNNNIKETLPQFSEESAERIVDLHRLIGAMVTAYMQTISGESTMMSLPGDSELGQAYVRKFKPPEDETQAE
jgi:hypothetical protein